MAVYFKLSFSFTFLVLLAVIFDSRKRYMDDINRSHLWNHAVEIYVGRSACETNISSISSPKRSNQSTLTCTSATQVCFHVIKLSQKTLFINLILLCAMFHSILEAGPSLCLPSTMKGLRILHLNINFVVFVIRWMSCDCFAINISRMSFL